MNLTLPPELDTFRKSLLQLFAQRGLDTNRSYFFGGCIRDFLLGKTPKDYDIILGYRTDKIKEILREENIIFEEKSWSTHIFLDIGGIEVQMMEYLNVEYDFTINKFKASLKNLHISAPRQSFNDLQKGIIRAIDDSPRMFRRCIYMLYKFPRFQPTKKTLIMLNKCICNEDQIKKISS